MEPVLEHLREFYRIYLFAAAVAVPLIVIFRRYTVPAITYAVEFAIYSGIMHVVVAGVVRVAGWFKAESSMKRAFGPAGQDTRTGWTTPLLEFWKRDLYHPQWLIYLEVLFLVGILALMWHYKPLRPQKKGTKPPPPKKPAEFAWQQKKTKGSRSKGKFK